MQMSLLRHIAMQSIRCVLLLPMFSGVCVSVAHYHDNSNNQHFTAILQVNLR